MPYLSPQLSPLQMCVEISRIIKSSHDTQETLERTAKVICRWMQVDACSIYVHDAKSHQLILRATFGLNEEMIGTPLSNAEGLVGIVFQTGKLLQVEEMVKHAQFKLIPGIKEDNYQSFIGVPFIEHREPFGVLALNTADKRFFTDEEQQLLTTISSQIAGLISKALLIGKLNESARQQPHSLSSNEWCAMPMAPGVALGKAVIFQKDVMKEPERLSVHTPEDEWELFQKAKESTVEDTLELIDKVADYVSAEEAAIFHAHLMFLEDASFLEKIRTRIDSGASATWSIYQTIQDYLQAFEAIDDPYLKERGSDLKDVGGRLLHNLGHGEIAMFEREGVLVAKQLLPGDIARLNPAKVRGIITSTGGAVSHAAILARSLMIPAVLVGENELQSIKDGNLLALNGTSGDVFVHPSSQTVELFQRLLIDQQTYLMELEELRDEPCVTADNEPIQLLANVGQIHGDKSLKDYGAEGIGLYRTEVYFLSLDHYPSVEEQVVEYQNMFAQVPPEHPIVIRTLDVGGDKYAPYMPVYDEENPFLGKRALRQQLESPEILEQQLQAILIAAQKHPSVQLLFPMITQLSELQQAKELFLNCHRKLKKQGVAVPMLKIGAMFEVPAALLLCDQILSEIDFVSVGSNDLTQYVLAVDRNNPHISHMYDPLHPAILKLIDHLAQRAQAHQKPIEVCGEMASDPEGCVLLLGMGVRKLSMNMGLIPFVKKNMQHVKVQDAQSLLQDCLKMQSAHEVRKHVQSYLKTHT